jgi:hypothetical protein
MPGTLGCPKAWRLKVFSDIPASRLPISLVGPYNSNGELVKEDNKTGIMERWNNRLL